MGRHGLYFRQNLNKQNTFQNQNTQPRQQSASNLQYNDIDSLPVDMLTDFSSLQIVDTINKNLKRRLFWPLSLLFFFLPEAYSFLGGISPFLIYGF